MRTIHLSCSSILVLSLIAGCSGGAPGDEEGLDEPVGSTAEQLFTVGGSCPRGSTLSNPNNNPVMHGTVNVYFIWYGQVSGTISSLLPTYVKNLSESSYLAMNSVYGDGTGPTTSTLAFGGATTDAIIANAYGLKGAPYSQGTKLTDANIKTEVDRAIAKVFPRDPNGVYFVVADSSALVTAGGLTTCNPLCGFHTDGVTSTTRIKYGYIVDPSSTSCGCRWPVAPLPLKPTQSSPHDIETDSTISVFTHELVETLTDPYPNAAPAWQVQGAKSVTENADLCEDFSGPVYYGGHPDFLGNLTPGGFANLHLGSDDYLVQMDWVNPDNSGAQSYALPFWEQNFGYTSAPVGDWAYGSYKAQCSSGQPVTGVSSDPSETHMHGVLCQSDASWPLYQQSSGCYGLPFNPGNNMVADPEGDWDPPVNGNGFYKAECNTNEFVAGVSQSTSGQIDGIMCCPGIGPSPLRHLSCNVEAYYLTNSFDYRGPDWDVGYYKGECAKGMYVAGVSSTADGYGSAHALLCCHP